jgi:uncharacterized membrane protein YeaQ/YmgE (transglycosylase-associated protein family)
MNILEFLLLLLLAGICGSVGASIVGARMSFVVLIIVGFIGAMIGRWISVQIGMPEWLTLNIGGKPFPVLWAVVGSALFVGIVGLFWRRRVYSGSV